MEVKMDSKGRLYIPKDVRKGIGKEFYLVRMDNEIILVPKPKDPVKKLEELGRSLPDVPIKDLKKMIRKAMLEEIEEELK
ncbi:AbrB/MazE/SpoVT family DNA-binding domain-containing protein [Pyrococcus kukulkanii]|uniref:AbrB family transcriptional regulator n=1 Tax=Pyrococcus kukulkanii TaxID=1609559 RepID=A0A127B997_9EURY|nr:AbrB/MazE/SpoVT family DNA-binding domain-containing protein [Pyrococcus kukulkanii]AMM53359.1 AbrB family transcriptional regulator [Pyrococcus kukulkanii]